MFCGVRGAVRRLPGQAAVPVRSAAAACVDCIAAALAISTDSKIVVMGRPAVVDAMRDERRAGVLKATGRTLETLCEFCEAVDNPRHALVQFNGRLRVCTNCIGDLVVALRQRERDSGRLFPSDFARDYGFVNEERLRTDRPLAECVAKSAPTATRILQDGSCAWCLHARDGTRSLLVTAGVSLALMARHDSSYVPSARRAAELVVELPRPCTCCGATESLVALMGVGRTGADALCFECVILASETLGYDGERERLRTRTAGAPAAHWESGESGRLSAAPNLVRLVAVPLPPR